MVIEDHTTGKQQWTYNVPVPLTYEIVPVKHYQGIYDPVKKRKNWSKDTKIKAIKTAQHSEIMSDPI